jgi:hypothetical protein
LAFSLYFSFLLLLRINNPRHLLRIILVVNLVMIAKLRLKSECFCADRAFVDELADVNLFVLEEIVGLSVGSCAAFEVADVGLLAGVRSEMAFEMLGGEMREGEGLDVWWS